MEKTVVIDCLPESVRRYQSGWAVVAIDVIRATTTAITAAAAGWRCLPAPSIEAALALARRLRNPLLAGESGGDIPAGFEMDNSPALIASRRDTHRPLVLVSSSGTKVIHAASACDAVYLACFRNYSAVADYVAGRHSRIAVIGAGSKGEFREEDQACCAWLAARLTARGYLAQDPETEAFIQRWSAKPPQSCLCSRSVAFLKRTDRVRDLDFIFGHLNDLTAVATVVRGEVRLIPEEQAVPYPFAPVDRAEDPVPVA